MYLLNFGKKERFYFMHAVQTTFPVVYVFLDPRLSGKTSRLFNLISQNKRQKFQTKFAFKSISANSLTSMAEVENIFGMPGIIFYRYQKRKFECVYFLQGNFKQISFPKDFMQMPSELRIYSFYCYVF